MSIGSFNRKIGRFTDWGVAIVAFLAATLLLVLFLDLPDAGTKTRLQVAGGMGFCYLLSGFFLYRVIAAGRHTARDRERAHIPPPDAEDPTYDSVPVAKRHIKPPMHRARRRLPPGN